MARKPKSKTTPIEHGVAELMKRALGVTKGDRDQAAGLMMQTIVELWSTSPPTDAARALYSASEFAKRAAQHHTAIAQIRALEAELALVTTDDQRESIVAAIRRLTPMAPSPEALRINAVVQQHHLRALRDHRPKATTLDERRSIDEHIARLETAPTESA